ncbi:response regulator [Virgibacillus sp. 179-BFC.A HS]|uniref:Response regulator n=1 Tax=Tigheibacillus jepli TaxID=3035914 RepID=A0ABU5CFR0_9BACI|nr:response regulator [Virgibacillus sp. 179-BFC.A HS]MDY0404365.1 response regulator [Virgibacillus sp. 179-BFC.A HS]
MIRVMIVEDDYRVAGIHEAFFKQIDGIQVIAKALNGKEALEILQNEAVDLILLDIYLPDMLGTTLVQKMRKMHPNVDIITISAATEKNIVQAAIQRGIFDYIIKPVKMDRFIQTIEKYKQTREALQTCEHVDQRFLDDYFGHGQIDATAETPKGIDPITLEKIKAALSHDSGISAEEMGAEIGVSRTTARRYLEYLISVGACRAELAYGIVGRPERKYRAM